MNAQEKLIEEIERVVIVRERFKELRGMRNVIVEPQIAMQTASIEKAKKAAASNDALEVLAALKDLADYNE